MHLADATPRFVGELAAKLDAGSVRTKRTVEGNPGPAIAGILKRVGAVALFALVVGFVLPAVIARQQNVFSRSSMLIKVHDLIITEEAARKIIVEVSFDHKKDTVTTLSVRPLQSSDQQQNVYPISVQPFYLHLISVLRPIEFFCFGICAFVMQPSCTRSRQWLTRFLPTIFALTVVLWLIYDLPLYFRVYYSTETVEDGRAVFAYSNPDLSFPSYIVQNFQFFVSCGLLAIIWVQWLSYAYTRYVEVTGETPGIDQVAVARLSFTMIHWQAACGLVSAAFVLYTILDWQQIIVSQDNRYLYETVDTHVVWLITLIIITAPIAITWFYWRLAKSRFILDLNTANLSADDRSSRLAVIQELEPISQLNATVSGAGVLLSLVFPIVQALLSKSGHV